MNPSSSAPTPTSTIRRYDLDWLRVIAFGLLIFFHVGVGFVSWGIYAYENNQTIAELELVLHFINQWHMAVLFLISGMGAFFALNLKRRSTKQYLIERSKRLLIPLLFAMNFVVIFQGYYWALHRGQVKSVLDFALGWWSHFGEWQHLWFISNLFIYSLMAAPLFLSLRDRPDGAFVAYIKTIMDLPKGVGLLLLMPIPLIMIELFIKPWAFGILGLGYQFPWYLVFFVIGYLCIMVNSSYWKALEEIRYISLILGIIFSVVLFTLTSLGDIIVPGYSILLLNGGWVFFGDAFWGPLNFPVSILHALNAWFWCLMLLSWGARFLNRPNKRLAYLNQAVLPFYIIHMSFLLVALYFIKDADLFWPLKYLIITGITVVGTWATFELLKRTKVTRLLFGIKELPKTND